MKQTKRFLLFVLIVSHFPLSGFSQNDTIEIPYTNSQINIDGNLSEWKTYYSTVFTDTSSKIHTAGDYSLSDVNPPNFREDLIPLPLSRNKVRVMMCWDSEALYVGFIVIDNHFVAEFKGTEDNPNIYLNDGIEFYIDTKNDSKGKMDVNDYQIIIDILNQQCVFKGDIRQIEEDVYIVPKERGQNLIIESAVSYYGTINQHKNGSYYIVEIRIPFLSIGMEPYEGQVIKIDVCNNDSDFLLSELPVTEEELYYTWPFNWSGIGDFGFPDTWKTAKLTGGPSLFNVISEKYKHKWMYFLGAFVLFTLFMLIFLILKIRKIRRLPDKEIVKKYIVLQNTEENQITDNNENTLLRHVSQYIYKNISDKITPQDVADNINMSLRSLQRLTKNELDCTPVALINSIKLQYALHLLQNNKELNISEIAYDSGFSDPAYFSKLFKTHFGISPKNVISGETPENQ